MKLYLFHSTSTHTHRTKASQRSHFPAFYHVEHAFVLTAAVESAFMVRAKENMHCGQNFLGGLPPPEPPRTVKGLAAARLAMKFHEI